MSQTENDQKVNKTEPAAAAHPSAAAIDDVFLQHLNSLPASCEGEMRPLIEAARKDLKTRLAGV